MNGKIKNALEVIEKQAKCNNEDRFECYKAYMTADDEPCIESCCPYYVSDEEYDNAIDMAKKSLQKWDMLLRSLEDLVSTFRESKREYILCLTIAKRLFSEVCEEKE